MISRIEEAMTKQLDDDIRRQPQSELEVLRENLELAQKVLVIQDRRLKVLEDWFERITKQMMKGDENA